ncbi:MAG: ATP-binding cassette domain-containing protein, partial [Candidatus Jidaibacter sp.]|nr:ATP-binding cassette domain-containing protein [Candidatus Jidaibacter sp.]
KKIAESQEALESLEGNKVYVTLTNPSKGTYVKYKCKYDKLAQSVHITGGNGSGKSCILRAIARSNILSSNPRSTTTISLYGKGLKKSDVVYIPQSGITALTNLTIYKNLADNTALSSWLSIIPSFVEDQKTGENIAGITPLDIFTAFLNKSQKDENENDIKEKIDELVKALDLKIFINTEDQKLVDLKKCIQLNPSGGEEHKIKFIMLALTALYGEKKLILVDELYNNLDQESTKVIQEQFINLLGEVKEKGVKFISTDHRETIAEGLYHKTEVLKAQSIS